ncbi:MAG: DUF1887 family protein [Oscillospiraceae bacterium]|nr:DUF1887 family protein [Oscillospiraceae bacterium]
MKTLIELYDERPLENVLGVEMFRPERVVYICPKAVASDPRTKRQLRAYFEHRGLSPKLQLMQVDVYDAEAVLQRLREILARDPDCAIDITGGTDAVLFAAGLLSAEARVPVFTYSRRQNRFYDIRNAPFAAELACDVRYSVEDCFRMAGGVMRSGRVDHDALGSYMPDIEPFFRLYMAHRREWIKIVNFLQRVSQTVPEGPIPLEVRGAYEVKGERGSRIQAPEAALRDLEEIGFLQDLRIEPEERVSFRFRDQQIRAWLRDVGSVLELYVYKTCVDLELFDDVRISAVVDWEANMKANAVSNELDVMCTRGVTPVFISCKTCDVKTEALNELAILRDRFGGQMAKAAIVTAERGSTVMRNRAGELNIRVIDLSDLQAGRAKERIRALMRAER